MSSTVLIAPTASGQEPVSRTLRTQMQVDAAAARKTWSRFAHLFAKGEGDSFLVKRLFTEGEKEERREELLWIRVTGLEKGKISGQVANRPSVVRDTKNRDTVQFAAAEIMDWLVVKNRTTYAGGYSLGDAEPMRSMRHDSDRANLPFTLLQGFLAGVRLTGAGPGEDVASFQKKAWARVFVELKRNGLDEKALDDRRAQFDRDFDALVLPRQKVDLLMTRPGKPATGTVTLTSDKPDGFRQGELLFKIQVGCRKFFKRDKTVVFGGLMFVSADSEGLPTYAVQTDLN